MAFDWTTFLDQRGIDYADRGPSTSRGNVYIHCPFCGDADQGRHMGISVENKGWGCWRNAAHRGKAPQRLIQAILGCSWAEAAKIVGKRLGGGLWGAADAIGQMLAGFEKVDGPLMEKLRFPHEFKTLTHDKTFCAYLTEERGFHDKQVVLLTARFNLMCARSGDFTYRIILPIYDEYDELVTWTGRAINSSARIRYKTLTNERDKLKKPTDPLAHGPITNYLFDMKQLYEGGKFLVIVEGPLDALKLTLAAKQWGAQVTCLFGKVVSDDQLNRLADLSTLYDAMFLVLDPEAAADAMLLGQSLAAVGVTPHLLKGEHDPGDMTPKEITALFDQLSELARNQSRPFAISGDQP